MMKNTTKLGFSIETNGDDVFLQRKPPFVDNFERDELVIQHVFCAIDFCHRATSKLKLDNKMTKSLGNDWVGHVREAFADVGVGGR